MRIADLSACSIRKLFHGQYNDRLNFRVGLNFLNHERNILITLPTTTSPFNRQLVRRF